MNTATYLSHIQQTVAQGLIRLPDSMSLDASIYAAVKYCLALPGKRLRPSLIYACGELCDGEQPLLDTCALAVELIHTYSLVHDDLPAMDDDAIRRGQPSCHVVFGDAVAILVGDALQAMAFELLSSEQPHSAVPASQRMRMINILASHIGPAGIVAGQCIDITDKSPCFDAHDLTNMHGLKTGKLIQAACLLGALCTPCVDEANIEALSHYGYALGIAYQIQDDILDVESDTKTLGKPSGSDQAADKLTFPALLGLAGAKRALTTYKQRALDALQHFGEYAARLQQLTQIIVHRNT